METICTTDILALIISTFSAMFTGGALLWIIYQHLEKPRIKNMKLGIELIELVFLKIAQISMFISVLLVFVHENAC